MSEELLQNNLLKEPEKIGDWNFYNIGATTIKQLKENNIIESKQYVGIGNKKPDALITYNKKVIALIENKRPSEFRTKTQKEKAIKQELKVAEQLTKILIVTDTSETIWINALTGERIKDEKGNEIKINFDKNDEEVIKLIKKINYSIDDENNQLRELKEVDPTDLAKSIWQDVWSVSGATPENCLYTFVELFIFKYLSDLGVLEDIDSFDFLVNLYSKRNDESVLEYYATHIRPKIKQLFKENPKDKTTIINGTIFISKDEKAVQGYSAVFRKVLFKFRDYGKLENINYDFKSKLFESFLKESISKKNWGQFFTPLKVVQSISKMVEIKAGMNVCDPACGVGKFLLEPILKDLDDFYEVRGNKLKSKIKLKGFDKGFDKDEQKTIILAKANMLIYFSNLIKENPQITNQFSDLFNETFELKTNSILGTLADPRIEEFDLILTNPPYVTSGSSNLKDEIKKRGDLEKHYKINSLGIEGLFVEWIIRALKKKGQAVIVIPDGILNRVNDKKLRQFLMDECFIDAIISLPNKTFFTTIKKTYVIILTKKNNKNEVQKHPVFTYFVSNIGETLDVYRFDIPDNDLEEAVILYNQFKGAKGHFKTTDKRCKIVDFEFISKNVGEHWSIDRWWSKEEKIELGIIEKENELDLEEFYEFIDEISNSINEYKEQLKEIKQ